MGDKPADEKEEGMEFSSLEYWKNFGDKDFSKQKEEQKKGSHYSQEDKELANYQYKYLPHVITEKRLDLLEHPDTQEELEMAKRQNEYYMKQAKEHEKDYCTFFMKTGACRYGTTCKRGHVLPIVSETILVEQMFRDPLNRVKNLAKSFDDSLLEFDEEELQKKYNDFYDDVFPEWRKYGKIVFFKCCNNLATHLRGNIFIQYENVEDAVAALVSMQGRFYDNAQLRVTFSPIKDWKQAICTFNAGSCPKYSECNFLHVYKNPRDEFPITNREQGGQQKKKRFQRDDRHQDAAPQDRRDRDFRPNRRRSKSKSGSRSPEADERKSHKKHYKRRSRSRSRSRSHKHDKKSKKDSKKHKSHHHHKRKSRDRSRSPPT